MLSIPVRRERGGGHCPSALPAMPPLSSPAPSPCASSVLVSDETALPPSPIPVNPACSSQLTAINSGGFQGHLLIKMRGAAPEPATDPSTAPAQQPPAERATAGENGAMGCCAKGGCCLGGAECGCAAAYFSSHPSVQLDVSIQGRFLQPTTSVLWMAAELSGPAPFTLQLPWLKRAMIKVIAQLISAAIPHVHWTLGDAGKGEYPAIAFPLVKAMDRLHRRPLSATHAHAAAAADDSGDDSPPPLQLGWQDLPPSVPSFSRQSLSLHTLLESSHMYSFSFYSSNLDLVRWKVVHLPGLSDVDLHVLWGEHPLRLQCYELLDDTQPHSHDNRRTFFDIQLQHTHTPSMQAGGAEEGG